MDTVSRRTVLRGALSAVALAGAGPVLAACGNSSGAGPAESNNSGVLLPSYVPLTNGPKADLPALSNGVLAGFLKYPANPVSVTSGKPGDGSTVAAFVETFSPVAPALSQNRYWQALNQALGVNLDMQVVPGADYSDKLNVLVAGSSLPDLTQISGIPPNLPSLLQAEFQDLSEFLAGDKVKEYPLLANIPTVYWKTAVYNGALYGVPIPRSVMGDVFYYRADILAAKGLNPQPASYAEFASLCRELSDPAHNVWALADANDTAGVRGGRYVPVHPADARGRARLGLLRRQAHQHARTGGDQGGAGQDGGAVEGGIYPPR
jgi:putative aldouronate transport system substrate-binding protein